MSLEDSRAESEGLRAQGGRGTDKRLLLLSSIGGAVSNFGILFVVARNLDVARNEEFLVFWSLLFGLFGVLSGIQNEATRATSAPSRRGSHVIAAGISWGLLAMLVVALSAPIWSPHLLPRSGAPAAVTLALTALLYPVYVSVIGGLGGSRRWDWYGGSLLIEVGLRVLLVIGVAMTTADLVGFEVASAAAVVTVVIILVVSSPSRRAWGSRTDVGYTRLLRNGALAMSSTAFTALLVTGYPVLLKATNPTGSLGLPHDEAAAITGACILAISLTRAPIMMPLTAFVGVAISAFTQHTGTVWSAVRRPFILLAAVGLAGAAAAWPIGPWFLQLFKHEYSLPGWYFTALVASSVLLAWLTILGALALATNRHATYSAGWGVALIVAAGTLLLPGSLLEVTAMSLALGPAAGCLVFFLALGRRTAER